MMNNFSLKDNKGQEHWISRSVSIVMFVFCKNLRGEWCVLASQRGEGTPDPELINAWNCQCGYLDYNETTKEAAQRETLEETGIKVKNLRYFGSQPWPYPCGLMVGFNADYDGGSLHLQRSEISKGAWFTKDNLPTIPEPLSIARMILDDWINKTSI